MKAFRIAGLVMAALLRVAATGWGADSNLTTVFFPLHTMLGTAQNHDLVITPMVNPVTSGTNIYWSPTFHVSPMKGVATVGLLPNHYQVTMEGLEGSFDIYVPATNTVQDARWLTTNLLSYVPAAMASSGAVSSPAYARAWAAVTPDINDVGVQTYIGSPPGSGAPAGTWHPLTNWIRNWSLSGFTVSDDRSAVTNSTAGNYDIQFTLSADVPLDDDTFEVAVFTNGVLSSIATKGASSFVNLYVVGGTYSVSPGTLSLPANCRIEIESASVRNGSSTALFSASLAVTERK